MCKEINSPEEISVKDTQHGVFVQPPSAEVRNAAILRMYTRIGGVERYYYTVPEKG